MGEQVLAGSLQGALPQMLLDAPGREVRVNQRCEITTPMTRHVSLCDVALELLRTNGDCFC